MIRLHPLFKQAVPVIQTIEQAGYEAYFVGGGVRDQLLGRDIHDIDIATSALPEEIKSLFRKTVDVGIEHGTVLVIYEGVSYEVTTFRTESGYVDHRRPESVRFIRSLEDDLKRRDFTINSMAMDAEGRIIDPFQGRDDLTAGVIRTVGNAEERFGEDALRLLRAIRFSSQLGFRLENDTWEAMRVHAPLLRHIAVERKAAEMCKLLSGRYKQAALLMLEESELHRFMPALLNDREIIHKACALEISKLTEQQCWILFLLVSGQPDPAEQLKEWRFPGKKIKAAVKALGFVYRRQHTDWTKEMLFQAGLEAAVDAEAVFRCTVRSNSLERAEKDIESLYSELEIKSLSELAVSGGDLLKWSGRPGGPWVKEALEQAAAAVLENTVNNDQEEIKRWLIQWHLL